MENQENKNQTVYGEKRPVSVHTRLINASRYSIQGLTTTFRKEQAFRFQSFVLLLAFPLAFWFGESPVEVFSLIASVLLVMIVELLNTGIENIVDRVSVEHHKLSGRSKDAASAAVFVSILLASTYWLIVIFD